MDTRQLCTEMPCGHPFTSSQVKTLFDNKTTTSRWRKNSSIKKTFSLSKNSYISNEDILSIKSIKAHGMSPVNMILTIPYMRQEVLNEWKEHWPDTCAPELYILNRYCQTYFKKPFYKIDGDCVRNDLMEQEMHAIEDNPFAAASTYFAQALKEGTMDVSLLTTYIFKSLSDNPNNAQTHHALWAVCSIYNCSLPIQYILHLHPELEHFYNFLDWYVIDDVFDDENCMEQPRTEYRDDYNFYHKYPSAMHSGFVAETLASFNQHIVSNLAKKIFSGEKKSVYHSHHKISEFRSLILNLNQAKNTLDLYFRTYFKDIALKSLWPLESYIKDREGSNDKVRDFTGESALKPLKLDKYIELKESFSTKKFDDISTILSLENERLQNIFKDLRNSLASPFEDAKASVEEYRKLSSDPIKNRHTLTELLSTIDNQIKASIKDIEDSDAIFYKAVEQLGEALEFYEIKDDDEHKITVELLREDLQNKVSDIKDKEIEIEQLKEKLNESTHKAASAPNVTFETDTVAAIKGLIQENNVTPLSILNAIKSLYPEHIIIAPSAVESAKKVEQFRQTTRMFDMLNTLVTRYLPMILSGNPDSEAKKCFGSKSYAANESKTVSQSTKLMHFRTFRIDNEDVQMQQHLNIGVAHDTLQTMRIYFKIINGRVVIGYAGKHLPTD